MAAPSASVAHHRARIGALTSAIRAGYRQPDDADLFDAKRSLAVEQLVEHAQRVVSGWPAPTREQLQRVAAILLTAAPSAESGGVSVDAA
jgi:hypothetical protein